MFAILDYYIIVILSSKVNRCLELKAQKKHEIPCRTKFRYYLFVFIYFGILNTKNAIILGKYE